MKLFWASFGVFVVAILLNASGVSINVWAPLTLVGCAGITVSVIRGVWRKLKSIFKPSSPTDASEAQVKAEPDEVKIDTDAPLEKTVVIEKEVDSMSSDVIVPKHKLLILSINNSVSDGKNIYSAAQCAWKLNVDRARDCDYVLAHQKGHIVGVFTADEWLPATSEEFSGRAKEPEGRWGFVGQTADSEVLLEYFNKKLPSEMFKKGAANPVRFLDPATNISEDNSISENHTKIEVQQSSRLIDFQEIAGQIGDLVESFEEKLYSFDNIPSGFCGWDIGIDTNEVQDLRLNIKIGSEDSGSLELFDGDDFIDELLESEFEIELDAVLSEIDTDSSSVEFVVSTYVMED